MKFYAIAIGAGIGYLAGNEQARHKTAEMFKRVKSSPQAKAVEERVSDKVTDLTSKNRNRDVLDVTDPSYVGGADAVDTESYNAPQRSAF